MAAKAASATRLRFPWPVLLVTLGAIPYSSLHHTAIANDGHEMLVALVRRPGETLHRLLNRLDRALLRAVEKRIYVSELYSTATDARRKPQARAAARRPRPATRAGR